MKLLAIDTSSVACTVAAVHDERLAERHEEQPREHTRLLIPMIREVLQEIGCDLDRLDAIVLGNGPGSFIGMRIAASVAQGLAFGAGLKIVPVSSLAAVAAEVFATSDADEALVAQDAHMHEVYLGAFSRGDGGRPEAVFEECLQGAAVIPGLDPAYAPRRLAAGAGWERYPDIERLNRHLFAGLAPVRHPRARFLINLARIDDAIDAADISPAYLRQKVAAIPETPLS